MMRLGWIGCGNMGVRMAERLAAAGNQLYVYNRTASKTERVLETRSARRLDSPKEIAENSDIIFTSITNDVSMRAILCGDGGMLEALHSGQILVEMSTLSPEFSVELESIMHERGVQYLNAPVIGSMFMIEEGLLKIIASGDSEAYETVQPYFSQIGRLSVYMGKGARARFMKIAVNMMICSYLTIYGEILSAGEGMGFSWDDLNDLLESSAGASPMLKDKGTTLRERIWSSETALTSTALKDLGLALDCAAKGSFALPLTAEICQYDRFMHYNPKYETYSSFGTIGVLEDIAGRVPGDYPEPDENSRIRLSEALTDSLTGVTTLLAAEAAAFCREADIDRSAALECLGTCHGATVYYGNNWKSILNGAEADDITFGLFRTSLEKVLQCAKEAGLFLPIMAEASQQLNLYIKESGPEAGILSIF